MKFNHSIPKVLICGSGRCGSSWLNRMLIEHPDVVGHDSESRLAVLLGSAMLRSHFYPKGIIEPFTSMFQILLMKMMFGIRLPRQCFHWRKVLITYARGQKKVSVLKGCFGREKLFDSYVWRNWAPYGELCGHLDSESKMSSRDRVQSTMSVWAKVLDSYFLNHKIANESVLVEKSPTNVHFLEEILENLPESKIIEIIRDGRDVCASMKVISQYHDWVPPDIIRQANAWVRAVKKVEIAKKSKEYKGRILTVRFEDLKTQTSQELKKIFNFIGIDATDDMIFQIGHKHHIDRVKDKGPGKYTWRGDIGRWNEILTEKELEAFKVVAWETMIQTNYATE